MKNPENKGDPTQPTIPKQAKTMTDKEQEKHKGYIYIYETLGNNGEHKTGTRNKSR